MIDDITILTKGGVKLWSKSYCGITGNPINELIRNILVEDRVGEKQFETGTYILKWILHNDLDLIFVLTYQKIVQLKYGEELLFLVKENFISTYKEHLIAIQTQHTDIQTIQQQMISFSAKFKAIMKEIESKFASTHVSSPTNASSSIMIKKKYTKKTGRNSPIAHSEDTTQTNNSEENDSPNGEQILDNQNITEEKQVEQEAKDEKNEGGKKKKKKGKGKKKNKKGKSGTVWDSATKVDKQLMDSLDFSKHKADDEDGDFSKRFRTDEKIDLELKNDAEEDVDIIKNTNKGSSKKGGFLSSFYNKITGNKVLEDDDLEPILEQFKDSLIGKNVASEIATKICDSVKENLKGKKIGTFESITTVFKQSLEESLTRILSPKKKIDVLLEATTAREEKRPYVITMVGVNGVGKSTTLAKICFYLLQNGFTAMIAAGDTFRSGAVEQLKIHAKCLGIPLFQRGYGKDTAIVAKEAISFAKKNSIDVVIVDTAGRMQDNEPLMRSLTKVITMNKPDLVLFVGEALVGNDGVDQLVKFNSALANLSTSTSSSSSAITSNTDPNETTTNSSQTTPSNLIDGIVLTKFDTIDDKVGAAISMVYSTGHPIVFIGVGQTYTDLKKLSIKNIVNSLLS